MLYTHAWGIFFGVGSVLALIPIWRVSDDRRGLLRDAVLAYVGAGDPVPAVAAELHLPGHAHGRAVGAADRFGAPVLLSRDLLGGDRITVALLLAIDHRARPVVHQALPAQPRGDGDVDADR